MCESTYIRVKQAQLPMHCIMAIYGGFDHYSFASSWIAFPVANVGPEAEGAESHVEIKEATGRRDRFPNGRPWNVVSW